jgi:hypothetical protein
MEILGGGIIGLILLALIIWAGLNVVLSNASMLAKVLWLVALIVLPFIGFLGWLFFGPRRAA